MVLERLKDAANKAATDPEFLAAMSGNEFGLQLQVSGSTGTETVMAHPGIGLLTLKAPADVWQQVLQPAPAVGFHSFTALCRQNVGFEVLGYPLQVAQSLHALERLFELLRGQQLMEVDHDYPDLTSIVGRYSSFELPDGRNVTVYFERAGTTGKPILLMLHTAGADGRQFHPLMVDAELGKCWDLYTFDLPGHGRSMPLRDTLWQGYKLTGADYLAICYGFMRQVLGQPVVVMGCSMGAAMALMLARDHPEWVSAAVALEAPFRSKGRRVPWLAHPAVNQAAHNPSYVRGLLSPSSPLFWRRVATWIYSQGGFGVYAGDLSFYSDEFNAEHDLKGLDGRRRVISLLTGSYDYSATPADSSRVAAMIPGARFTEIPDLGHFPMIENPSRLLPHLRAELDHIRLIQGQYER